MNRAPIGFAARQINRLFVEGTISGLSDGQLLERFLDGRDEAAFAALVERHGPMVFCTCQGVIRDQAAAEDAFQATFLVLVCKARTIRGREAIGGWLHRVAYRIAVQANTEAARRRRRERPVENLVVEDRNRDDVGDELRQIVLEEVARLSEKYRLPVLLCDFEGKTHAQAASELKVGEATLRRRLAGARELLRSRLARRGVALTAAGVSASLGRPASASASGACVQATVKAAGQISSAPMRIAIAEIVSTATADLVNKSLRAMVLAELKTLVGVAMAIGVLGCVAWGFGLSGAPGGRPAAAMAKPRRTSDSPPAQPKTKKPDAPVGTFSVAGRVIDPEGRPLQGASIYLISYRLRQPASAPLRATSGADGQFHFTLSRSEFESTESGAPWSPSTILARAKGYGFGIANVRRDTGELAVRVVRADPPIDGRILDLEGRPVAGVTVKVLNVRSTETGSLDNWLKALAVRKEFHQLDEFLPDQMEGPAVPLMIPPVATGADGTFRIEEVGRERVATMQIEGPTVESKQFEVRTRVGEAVRVPYYKEQMDEPNLVTIYGARFEHVAGPTRPIDGVVRDQDTGKPLGGIMVRGEYSLGNPINYVQAITDVQGRYRLIGLPRGREGNIMAVPPCDLHVTGSLKAALKLPPDEKLPYLPVQAAVQKTFETDALHLDIRMKRGVWVTGRVIDPATGKPVRGYVDYFVYYDNPTLEAVPSLHLNTYHFTGNDGTFGCVALPGPGVLAARAIGDRYVFGAGIEKFTHKPENGFLDTLPHQAIPTNYHVLVEIDAAKGTATLTRDLLLQTGRSLTVTALGPDGTPLTDMKIAGLKDMGYWETPPADATTHTIIDVPGQALQTDFSWPWHPVLASPSHLPASLSVS